MIPQNITHDHIRQAADRIDKEGIPKRRKPNKYLVSVNNKYYPVMLIISLGNYFANRNELRKEEFTPQEAIRFLIGRGFYIETLGLTN